jgi:hypothetical protein
MALIDWVSKKQATIETSVFGAEFIAMKHGIEKHGFLLTIKATRGICLITILGSSISIAAG